MKLKIIFTLGFGFWIAVAVSAFAEPSQISGVVADVRPAEDENIQLSIQSEQGVVQYLLDHRTPVEVITEAKEVQPGARILLPSDPDAPRNRSPYDEIKNQADEMQAPEASIQPPQPSELPEEVKQAQEEVQNQEIPNEPNEADLAAMQAAMQEGAAQGAGGEGGEKPKEPEEAAIPEELNYPVPVPRVLSKATPEDEIFPGQKVLKRQEVDNGIKLQLEGEGAQEVILSPEDKVIQLMEPAKLSKDMKVRAEVEVSSDISRIRRIALI